MITFDPLWETLQEKNISQYSLIKEYGFSTGTLECTSPKSKYNIKYFK